MPTIPTRALKTGLAAVLTLGAVSFSAVACSSSRDPELTSRSSDGLEEEDYSEWYSLYEWDCSEADAAMPPEADAATPPEPDAGMPLPPDAGMPSPPDAVMPPYPTSDAGMPEDPGLQEAPESDGGGDIHVNDRPRPPPRPPAPPAPACKPRPRCAGNNVPATTAALCPAARDVDRTDTSNCRQVPQANSNYSNAGGYWWCGPSDPHHPCVPTVTNGGNATHTHHDRERFNFNNGCCFYQKVRDVRPPTCAAP